MANADSSSRRGAQFGGGAIRPDDDYGKEATGQEGTFYGGKLNIVMGQTMFEDGCSIVQSQKYGV